MQSSEVDAVSTLARQVDAGDEICSVEACDMLSVLMIAGNETTTNLIGNGMLARAPSRADADLTRGAGPNSRRGERDVALRQSRADGLPDREGGDHRARTHDPARRWRHSEVVTVKRRMRQFLCRKERLDDD